MNRQTSAQFFRALLLCSCLTVGLSAAPLGEIRVQFARETGTPRPCELALPANLPSTLHLVEKESGRKIPAQVAADGKRLVFLPEASEKGSLSTTYVLHEGALPGKQMLVIDGDDDLIVRCGEREILRYRRAEVQPPKGLKSLYIRSGYIHPLRTPSGKIVTDDFAPDHPHQRGVFLAWTKTKLNGKLVDFWNLQKGQGKVRYADTLELESGPVFGRFVVLLEHVWLQAPGGEQVVIQEEQTVTIYNTPGENLIDFHSLQRAVPGAPEIKLPPHLYGGMAFRGARGWKEKREYLTQEGVVPGAPMGKKKTRSAWCSLAGGLGTGFGGALLLSSPRNFRHPEALRMHPKVPYFCFCPSQLGEWTLFGDKPSREFSYRLVVYDGHLQTSQAAAWFAGFTSSPTIQFISRKQK